MQYLLQVYLTAPGLDLPVLTLYLVCGKKSDQESTDLTQIEVWHLCGCYSIVDLKQNKRIFQFNFRLHQVDILGHTLVVEFSSKQHRKHHPTEVGAKHEETKEDEEAKKEEERQKKKEAEEQMKKEVALQINQMNEKFGMQYPLNPKLHYMYPPPTVSILTNIANAMASMPKFYVQVLHLMNKMNLPAPFGALTATPPLADDSKPTPKTTDIADPDKMQEAEMEMSSETESELESEGEEKVKTVDKDKIAKPPLKRKRIQKKFKRTKLDVEYVPKPKGAAQKVSDVFEQPEAGGAKKFAIRLPPGQVQEGTGMVAGIQPHMEGYQARQPGNQSNILSLNPPPEGAPIPNPKIVPPSSSGWNLPPTQDILNVIENKPPTVVEGGFGKLEPVSKPSEQEEEQEGSDEEEWGATEFISSRKLRRGRISHSEMKGQSAFRNYQEGEPTSRLYIKNLAKQVTDKDLHYVFGKYVDWVDEAQKLVFDIRLMKEGRMKGQAFITLPDEKRALDALRDTHGFLMKGKAMVVQFARSAKPKEKDEKGKDAKAKN